MKLASVTKRSNGGRVYHFTARGTWSNEVVAAPDFNPLTGMNAQLIESGFPPRSPDRVASTLSSWKSAIDAAKKRDSISVPVLGCTRH